MDLTNQKPANVISKDFGVTSHTMLADRNRLFQTGLTGGSLSTVLGPVRIEPIHHWSCNIGMYPSVGTSALPSTTATTTTTMTTTATSRKKMPTKDTTGALRLWLKQHKKNPYPAKAEKIMLAILSSMTLTQVSTWFANARRRLKKDFDVEDGSVLQYEGRCIVDKWTLPTEVCGIDHTNSNLYLSSGMPALQRRNESKSK